MPGSIERRETELGRLAAVWNAFWGRDIGHYPRFLDESGVEQQVTNDEVTRRIATELGKLKSYQDADIEFALRRGRETLDEVKGLTEYEDQKATRNLTVITFLSALAGVLFSGFVDRYPLNSMLKGFDGHSLDVWLVVVGYALFLCFVFCAVSGALVVFHATRIRFKYPKLTTLTLNENVERPKSHLFYSPIIQVLPERWAESFLENPSIADHEKSALNAELGVSYLRNYVIESYLVATKVADKLRYLMPAQDILSWSIRLLLIWIFIFAIAIAFIPDQSRIGTKASTALAATTGASSDDNIPDTKSALPAEVEQEQ